MSDWGLLRYDIGSVAISVYGICFTTGKRHRLQGLIPPKLGDLSNFKKSTSSTGVDFLKCDAGGI